jgi:hypothetical protein
MEGSPPSSLTGLFVVVLLSLAALVFTFLRMSGVLGHGRGGRPPPQTPMG